MIVETAANFRENLVDGARNQSSVLIVCCGAAHGKGLTGACLTVAQNGTVVAINDLVDGLASAVFKDFFL